MVLLTRLHVIINILNNNVYNVSMNNVMQRLVAKKIFNF